MGSHTALRVAGPCHGMVPLASKKDVPHRVKIGEIVTKFAVDEGERI